MFNSYSQCGEDRIVLFIKDILQLKDFQYLDIGAHESKKFNNTYLFYELGFRGTLVEPNPEKQRDLEVERPEDNLVRGAVSDTTSDREVFLYVLNSDTLSTTSLEEAQRVASYGHQKITKAIKAQAYSFNNLMKMCPKVPDYVSLDIEGIEHKALKALSFSIYRPKIFCIETRVYREDNEDEKNIEVIKIMEEQGYMYYGDTLINSIFVCENAWKSR